MIDFVIANPVWSLIFAALLFPTFGYLVFPFIGWLWGIFLDDLIFALSGRRQHKVFKRHNSTETEYVSIEEMHHRLNDHRDVINSYDVDFKNLRKEMEDREKRFNDKIFIRNADKQKTGEFNFEEAWSDKLKSDADLSDAIAYQFDQANRQKWSGRLKIDEETKNGHSFLALANLSLKLNEVEKHLQHLNSDHSKRLIEIENNAQLKMSSRSWIKDVEEKVDTALKNITDIHRKQTAQDIQIEGLHFRTKELETILVTEIKKPRGKK